MTGTILSDFGCRTSHDTVLPEVVEILGKQLDFISALLAFLCDGGTTCKKMPDEEKSQLGVSLELVDLCN